MKRRQPTSRAPRVTVVTLALIAAVSWAGTPRAADSTASAPATRIVVLIRHGLYDPDAPGDHVTGKGLVPVGRQQAKRAADRLAREGWRFDSLHVSPLRRARETAEIMGKTLRLTPRVSEDLAECTPQSRNPRVMADLEPGEAEACGAQLERAMARHLRPAVGAEARDLVVCHGNVIRYLVCRALGVDPEAWLGMRIANGSITEIEVGPDGTLRLVSFDDVGHLPLAMRTSTGRPAPAAEPR